ncbi:STAS domain-containing protein [Streptomyces sp. NPDC054949]
MRRHTGTRPGRHVDAGGRPEVTRRPSRRSGSAEPGAPGGFAHRTGGYLVTGTPTTGEAVTEHDHPSQTPVPAERADLIRVTGELDLDTDHAAALDAALRRAVTDPANPAKITVDVSGLAFCDSTGLNILIRAQLTALTQAAPSTSTHPTPNSSNSSTHRSPHPLHPRHPAGHLTGRRRGRARRGLDRAVRAAERPSPGGVQRGRRFVPGRRPGARRPSRWRRPQASGGAASPRQRPSPGAQPRPAPRPGHRIALGVVSSGLSRAAPGRGPGPGGPVSYLRGTHVP